MKEIIIAVVLVGGIGLAAGIVLALAGHFFAVKTDETVKKLREALPGANCGGCGYSGCDGYAQAVKEGASCSLCGPGGAETAEKLAEIMGVKAEKCEKRAAVVMCRGTSEVTHTRFQYEGINSCRAAASLAGGSGSCSYGCLGYGDCVRVCDSGGIRVVDKVARVDTSLCIACGKCVSACPHRLISLLPVNAAVPMCMSCDSGADTRKACKNGCIGCMKCVKICPESAVKVENFHAVIDHDKCVRCGLCAEACPLGVIYIRGART